MTDNIKNWYKEIKQDNKNKVDSNFNKHHIKINIHKWKIKHTI